MIFIEKIKKTVIVICLLSGILYTPVLATIQNATAPASTPGTTTPTLSMADFNKGTDEAMNGKFLEAFVILQNMDAKLAQTAVDTYEKAIKKSPNDWTHHFRIAFGYYGIGQTEKSKTELLKVLEINPKQAWAMALLGVLEAKVFMNIDKGIEWGEKAIALEPNDANLNFLMAEAYRQKGDFQRAFHYISKYQKLKADALLSL